MTSTNFREQLADIINSDDSDDFPVSDRTLDRIIALIESDLIAPLQEIADDYPVDLFPEPTRDGTPDRYTAAGARLAIARARAEQRLTLNSRSQDE